MAKIKTFQKLEDYAIKNGEDELLLMYHRGIENFGKYVTSVMMSNVYSKALLRFPDNNKLRNSLLMEDSARRKLHDSCISFCNMLNRHCEQFNIEDKFCDIDTSDRVQVAQFIGEIVVEYFDNDKMFVKNKEAADILDEYAKQDLYVHNNKLEHMSKENKEDILLNQNVSYEEIEDLDL